MAQSTRAQGGNTGQADHSASDIVRSFESHPKDLTHYLCEFAEENPQAAALWCLGIGFVLGWKLKPW